VWEAECLTLQVWDGVLSRRPVSLRGVTAVVVALALLALVVWLAGPERTFTTLSRLRIWQAVVLVLTAFGVSIFTAFAWQRILIGYGHRVRLWLLLRLTALSFAVGWIVPSGFVAGIPVAAYFLRRRGVPFGCGLASFTISRFFEITAYALVLPLVFLTGLGGRPLMCALAVSVLASFAVVYLDLGFGWRLARRGLARLGRRGPRFVRRVVAAASDFCATVAGFFRAPPRHIVLALAYSFAAIGIAFVRALLTNDFLALGLTLPELSVMFSITIFLMAVPFLPGAIGAYEGGIAGAFELLGRQRADGIAYAMTVHATELVVVASGVIVLAEFGGSLVKARRVVLRAAAAEELRRRRAVR